MKGFNTNLPERIAGAAKELAYHTNQAADLREQMTLIEHRLVLEILGDRDPATGKQRFSNEQMRDAELTNRRATSSQYQQLKAALRTQEEKRTEYAVLVERLRGEFRVWQLLKRREVAEMEAMAA